MKRSKLASSKSPAKKLSTLIERLEDRRLLSVSLNAQGFTVVTPSSDSRLIYVSTSGSDTNNTGLSPSSPVASISKAYGLLRNGYPDWILFERGDTFRGNFSNFAVSGRSQQEPIVVTDYGNPSLPRPVIDAGANNAFMMGKSESHIDVIGIAFTSSTHTPGGPNYNGQVADGFEDDGNTTDILIEDCSFSYFLNDLNLVGNSAPITDITIRRCEILDSFSSSTGTHSEGLFAAYVNGLNIEDSVFDHDGWNTSISGATPTQFNHDCYLHSSDNSVVVTNNIFADASSFGLQARSGGIIDDNVFINNAHAMSFGLVNGATTRAGGVSGEIKGNIFLADRQDASGWGFGIVAGNLAVGGNTVISNNIFANNPTGLAAIQFQPGVGVLNPQQEVGLNSVTVSNNIVYNWTFSLALINLYVDGTTGADGLTGLVVKNNDFQQNTSFQVLSHGNAYNSQDESFSGNVYSAVTANIANWFRLGSPLISFSAWQAAVEPTAVAAVIPFVDPTRSVATYMGSLGLTATQNAFIAGARALSATNWNPVYFASSLASYIQGGFAVAGSTGSVSGTVKTSGGAPIAGATVYVDINKNGSLSTGDLSAVTDSTGAYTINNIPPGSQIIRQVLPTGDSQTTPTAGNGISVTVSGGGSLSNENFVDALPTTGTVSGSVTDNNGDPIAGVTVYVDINNGGTLNTGDLSAITNSTGAYSIANVPAGPQTIDQVVPTADTQTTPTAGTGIQVTVTGGGTLFSENFIDALPTTGTVSGSVTTVVGAPIAGATVFVDINNDDTFDAGDPWAITDSTGAYSIANIPAGSQTIDQVVPDGDTQTTPTSGNGIPVTVVAGATLANQNFVDAVPSGSVSGFVTATDTTPIAGVTVYVDIDNSGTFNNGDLSAVTDSTGAYTINNVPIGAQTIQQVLPTGDTQTTPTPGSGIQVTLNANDSLTDEDFVDALPTTGTISGSVKMSGGAAIAGATVYVDIDNSNTFNTGDLSAVTNSTGAYTIANVPAGPQTILQVVPTGDTQTTPTGGTGIPVNVIAGGSLSNENFTDIPPGGSVSGTVKNNSGAAISGVTVYVDVDKSNTFNTGDLWAVTSSTGAYTINNVPAGTQIIRQVLPTGNTQQSPSGGGGISVAVTSGGSFANENFVDVPAPGVVNGFVKTSTGIALTGVTVYVDMDGSKTFNTGDLSAVTSSTGAYTIANVPFGARVIRQVVPTGDTQTTPTSGNGLAVTVTPGGSLSNENFIDTLPKGTATVSGSVKNSSGVGIAGVTVYLDANNDGKLDNGELSKVTTSTGAYSITGVPALATTVREVLPTGYVQTSPASNAGIKVTPTAGGVFSSKNFTDTNKGNVSGYIKTSAGKVLANVVVFIDTNDNGKLDSGEVSTKTSSTGYYYLGNILAGSTYVRQTVPSGHKQTTPGSGLALHVTIKAGSTLTSQNFTDT